MGEQAQLTPHPQADGARRLTDHGHRGRRQAGRAEHGTHIGAFDQRGAEGPPHKAHLGPFGVQGGQLRRLFTGVGHGHAGTLTRAPTRHRQAGRAQAQDEDVLIVQGGLAHGLPQLQGGQTQQAQQHGDDPEADHDLGLFPATLFEVVVQGRHLEQASASPYLRLVYLNQLTCSITDRASTTKMPPMMASTTSWRTMMATVPSAPPRARAPTSPMKTWAGWVLNHRKARPAPAMAEQKISNSPEPGMCGNSRYLL